MTCRVQATKHKPFGVAGPGPVERTSAKASPPARRAEPYLAAAVALVGALAWLVVIYLAGL